MFISKEIKNMRIRYEKAYEKNRGFFIHVHHTAYHDIVEEMFGWDKKKQNNLANQAFDHGGIHIIWKDDDRIGVIGWKLYKSHLLLKDFFLLPQYQERGIGSQIIKDIISKPNFLTKDICLRTLKNNIRAKKFYEFHGFKLKKESEFHWHMLYKFISIQI